MPSFNGTSLAWLAAVLLLMPMSGITQSINSNRLPLTINSETAVFDGKTSTMVYTGLQFIQGNISIEADEGRATTREQTDSTWQFIGNVVINVSNGHIECDLAELRFDGNVLTIATVSGTPATFELTRDSADDVTYAEAGKLEYDVVNGIIEFSEQALITESGNEISSSYLVYNINERQINADSSGNGDDRVRITYTPTEADLEQIQVETDEDTENP